MTVNDSERTISESPLMERRAAINFSSISPSQVVPSIEALLAKTSEELELIKSVPGERTFANTMVALDDLGVSLDFAMGLIGHLEGVATTPELRAAYNSVLPRVSEFKTKILLDAGLWSAVKEFAESPAARSLTGHEARYVTKTVDDFRRNGADLSAEKKVELSDINTELAQITNQFSQHVLDATNLFEHIMTSADELKGLPASAIAMSKQSAESKKISGWRFTLQAPSFIAIITYLDDRSVREKFYRAYNTRCLQGELDNVNLLYRILELRRKRANLLGFRDFSDLILADRMAKSGERAQKFVDEMRDKITNFVERDKRELLAFVEQSAGKGFEMMPWDVAYYAEKLRMSAYDFDEEELRPYFALDKVMLGLFLIVERVFGITVKENPTLESWAADVTSYSALDSKTGALLGHFYADFFPRETKRGGAWMDSFITGITSARDPLPHVGLIAGNFTPPQRGPNGENLPALLTHDEVTTLFHEFGHLMHLLCSKTDLRGQSMSGVAWDFIELPSQILENWCWDRQALDLFAQHHETGALIPETLFTKMTKARNFRSASALMRQVGFSTTDLALHRTYDRARDGDVLSFTRNIMQGHAPAPLPKDFGMIATFTHIFSSPVAYAAGYYSYQWAEVLDADAFSRFQREGLMNASVGLAFRDLILSRGDTQDPDELFRGFMGREPSIEALLTRAGLST